MEFNFCSTHIDINDKHAYIKQAKSFLNYCGFNKVLWMPIIKLKTMCCDARIESISTGR